jgi:hypothetical protein
MAAEQADDLFLYYGQGKRLVGAVYSVFGDESHDENCSRVFAVGGVLGSTEDWNSLKTAWEERTGGRVFHAADCETDFGDFAGADHQENQRLYADLTKLLVGSRLMGFGAAISLEDHKNIFPDALDNQPYFLCFRWVIAHFTAIVAALVPQDKVKYTFDRNPETAYSSSRLYDYMAALPEWRFREYLADEVSFDTRKNIGIQAADLVARETMKHLDNQIGPVPREIRRSMRALGESRRFHFDFFRKGYLEALRRNAAEMNCPGYSISEYHEWRERLRLPDTVEVRMRYHIHLDDLDRKAGVALDLGPVPRFF